MGRPLLAVTVSANAERVVALESDFTHPAGPSRESAVSVWNRTGKRLDTYTGPMLPSSMGSSTAAMALTPDGERVAVVTALGSSEMPEGAGLRVTTTDSGRPYFESRDPRARFPVPGLGPRRNRNKVGYQLVAFSRDGKRLAWSFPCSEDKPDAPPVAAVRVFDLSTRKELSNIAVPDGGVCSLAFHPDGTRLIGAVLRQQPKQGQESMTVHIWDVSSGAVVSELEPVRFIRSVSEIAFSPDGTRVAANDVSGVVIWDAESGRRLLTLQRRSHHFQCFAFSPDGRRIALAVGDTPFRPGVSWATAIILDDTATGDELLTLKDAGINSIRFLRFSPDGHRLSAVGTAGEFAIITIRTWDATPRPGK